MGLCVSRDVVMLGPRRRGRLEALVRRGTAQVREVTRARIVLAAAGRLSNAEIAGQVGVHVDTVRRVRSRFVTEGMSFLADRPRPGRPLVYDLDARLLVVATATSIPPGPETVWTHALIAAHLDFGTPDFRSRPVRSAGSWPIWISNRTWSGAG